jgi:peptide/nickel transport system ATP-binding protein
VSAVASEPLLSLVDVVKEFRVGGGLFGGPAGQRLRAVDGVSLEVRAGETLGLVGESGCGKSTLGRCMLRLLTPTSGTIRFDGTDISALSGRQLRPLRGSVQMIFQNPYGSLNPRRPVEALIAAPLRYHDWSRTDVERRLCELLDDVGLARALRTSYPHELSGGQRQRVGIARALALRPKLVVLDEPVSALDVSIQAQIVNLLQQIQRAHGLTYVFISHDLGVVRQLSERVAVMRGGRIVECGPVREVFESPRDAYTRQLLDAIPRLPA